jgi:hypothetical protein
VSIFSKIKDAIFGHKSAPAPTRTAPTPQPTAGQAGTQAPPQAPTQAPAQQVDVEQVLVQIAREKGNPTSTTRRRSST